MQREKIWNVAVIVLRIVLVLLPLLKLPLLDKLHSASVRLTDFHVDPT